MSKTILKETNPIPDEIFSNTNWKDNNSIEDIDHELKAESENTYLQIIKDIVEVSQGQLKKQNASKDLLKDKFTKFFIWFISIQYIILVLFLLLTAFCRTFHLSDTIVISYITSVFVETLGAIIFMIKYAFDSSQEVKVLEILNGVVLNFKKFKK